MPVNSLTRDAGIKLGPLVLETLVKHYFERILKDNTSQGKVVTQLRQDELLYDEAFNIVKTFLEASTKHTVEELQRFSNTRTLAPPWVRVVKLCVPMSCCDEAAAYLMKALGGEEMTKKLVGGTKWWQVRGLQGVDAEWIATKKDWHEHEKRHKAHERERTSASDTPRSRRSTDHSEPEVHPQASEFYQPEMDEMRCILYAHGGGYYFGSIDQERYSIQRHARKINGRIFAINYRLAPQYPFPCAIQDLLAAYLFLIRPPEGASHRPVSPAHIVVSGDSAGGGLCIALLQVLRDTGLPLPAGGVLISPWCDLTHSFPSIHTNTATDVIPQYGLSLYKPSTLWPPPPEEIVNKVQESLRSRIRQAIHLTSKHHHSQSEGTSRTSHSQPEDSSDCPRAEDHDLRLPETGQTLHLGSTASLPNVNSNSKDQTITCKASDGHTLTIEDQIHLYAPNNLLMHPLISPVVSYLGGLPPLFVIASDKEVLRDEIIYLAHKAAHPDQYLAKEEARALYPPLQGIEERYGPTQIHLQVYDDSAHILPVLFAFTTPAKYCHRAIASFIKYVTGMAPVSTSISESFSNLPITDLPITSSPNLTVSPRSGSIGSPSPSGTPTHIPRTQSSPAIRETFSSSSQPHQRSRSLWGSRSRKVRAQDDDSEPRPSRLSFRRAFSSSVTRVSLVASASGNNSSVFSSTVLQAASETRSEAIVPGTSETPPENEGSSPPVEATTTPDRGPESGDSSNSSDVAGPRFHNRFESLGKQEGVRTAGEPSVYSNGLKTMIRERVSTHGVIRPLESEGELTAFVLPAELIGVISELAMRRYLDGRAKFHKKFHKTSKKIAKHRRRNLEMAKKDATKNMTQLQTHLAQDEKHHDAHGHPMGIFRGVSDGLLESGSWSWAWALDVDEHPPASSIVARRDTDEAVRLARIADQSVLVEESMMSGNNLWSMIVNFLTVGPDKSPHLFHHHVHDHDRHEGDESGQEHQDGHEDDKSHSSKREGFRTKFAHFVGEHKSHAHVKDNKKTPPREA